MKLCRIYYWSYANYHRVVPTFNILPLPIYSCNTSRIMNIQPNSFRPQSISVFPWTATQKQSKKKRSQDPNIRAPDSKPKSIKSMFAAQAVKSKKKVEVSMRINILVTGFIFSKTFCGFVMCNFKMRSRYHFCPEDKMKFTVRCEFQCSCTNIALKFS